MGKRKHCNKAEVPPKRIRSLTCILHISTLSEYGHFTKLSACKGGPSEKLSYLNSIRDLRLGEATSSPYRMTDICEQIPSTLEGLDLDKIGYHQNCYKCFTGKLDRLQVSKASTSGESSSIKDSLRHPKSLSSQSEGAPRSSFLFPKHVFPTLKLFKLFSLALELVFCFVTENTLFGKQEGRPWSSFRLT